MDIQDDGAPSPKAKRRSGGGSSTARHALFATVKRAGKFTNKVMAAAAEGAAKVSHQAKGAAKALRDKIVDTEGEGADGPVITTVDQLSTAFGILLENASLAQADCELALRQALFKQGMLDLNVEDVSNAHPPTQRRGRSPSFGRRSTSPKLTRTTLAPPKHVGLATPKSPSVRRAKSGSRSPSAADAVARSQSGLDTQYDVTITVVEGRNLMVGDRNGFSDPYCKLDMVTSMAGSTTLGKTEVIMKTLNPRWDHSFTSVLHNESPSFELKVEVWDWDRVGRDDFLGVVTTRIKLSENDACEGYANDQWHLLEGDGIFTGEVRLIISLIHRAVGRGAWDSEPKLRRIAASVAEFDRNGAVVPPQDRRQYLHFASLLACRDMRQLAAWGDRDITKINEPAYLAVLMEEGLFWQGIPTAWRPIIYSPGLGVPARKDESCRVEPGYYKKLCKTCEGMQCAVFDEIQKDVDRTAEGKKSFAATSAGKQVLTRILKSYALRNDTMGFCQSLTYIVEALMLVSNVEEDIFWFLVCICEDEHFCAGYFVPSMSHYKADFALLCQLLHEQAPEVYALFEGNDMFIAQFVMSWLLTMFTTSFPAETALRLLDLCIFHGGSAMQVLISLSFVRMHQAELQKCGDCDEVSARIAELARTAFDPDRVVDAIKMQIVATPIASIRERQIAHRVTQDARTLDSIRARGSESLQTRGAYTEAAAVRLIERFVSEAIENPTGMRGNSVNSGHQPIDYIGISCKQFCAILTAVFGPDVLGVDGDPQPCTVPLVPLFENLDWHGEDSMRLSNFLTALAIFHGPPLGTSSAEILDYLFRCFDLDDTNTLDKVEFRRMEDALKTFSPSVVVSAELPFFEDYPFIEKEVFVQDPPTWLAKLVDHWVRATATIRAKVQEQAQTQAQTQVQTQSRSSDGTHASSELSVSPVGSPLSATLNLGDRVTVEGYDENGIIRFIGDHARVGGPHDGKPRVGIEFDGPAGKNNGTVDGVAYFSCPASHGVLVRPAKVELISTATSRQEALERNLSSLQEVLERNLSNRSGGSGKSTLSWA